MDIKVFAQSPEVHWCPTPLEAAQTQEASPGCPSSIAGLSPPFCPDHPPSKKGKVKEPKELDLEKSPGVIKALDRESLRCKVFDEDALQPHLLGHAQGAVGK